MNFKASRKFVYIGYKASRELVYIGYKVNTEELWSRYYAADTANILYTRTDSRNTPKTGDKIQLLYNSYVLKI